MTVSEHQQLLDWLRRLQTITAVALIVYTWGVWSASLIVDAGRDETWSASGIFGYGFMAVVGLFVISPLTVGPPPDHPHG